MHGMKGKFCQEEKAPSAFPETIIKAGKKIDFFVFVDASRMISRCMFVRTSGHVWNHPGAIEDETWRCFCFTRALQPSDTVHYGWFDAEGQELDESSMARNPQAGV